MADCSNAHALFTEKKVLLAFGVALLPALYALSLPIHSCLQPMSLPRRIAQTSPLMTEIMNFVDI